MKIVELQNDLDLLSNKLYSIKDNMIGSNTNRIVFADKDFEIKMMKNILNNNPTIYELYKYKRWFNKTSKLVDNYIDEYSKGE